VKADQHFPVCVGACGRRGESVVWYQIADNVRLGECLRCYDARQARVEKIDRAAAAWDPPVDDPTGPTGPTGPEDPGRPLPWKA
jgi:hypothetical protein